MKKLLAFLLVAIPFTSTAWAGTDSGFYIGGSLGHSAVDADVGAADFDEDATGYKAIVGYNFGLVPLIDLAVEADYRDFGSFDNGSGGVESDITSFDVYGLGGLNFGLIGVFAKLGYSNSDLDVSFDGGSFGSSDSNTSFGIGAKVQLTSIAIRAEYETFDLDEIDDLSMWSAGVVLTF